MNKLKVIIPTYNVARYIEETIYSVLNQKVSFDYLIHVVDDASTDGTIEIVDRLVKEFPGKIQLSKSAVNKGLLTNVIRAYQNIDAEYFYLIDGDDYLVDKDFLEKGIVFLEQYSQYTLYAANTFYYRGDDCSELVIKENYLDKEYSFIDYLLGLTPYIHTSAIIYRNVVYLNGLPTIYTDKVGSYEEVAVRAESFRFAIHLEFGKLYIDKGVGSVYRIHENGIWQGSTNIKREISNAIFQNVCSEYWPQYEEIFGEKRDYRVTQIRNYLEENKEGVNLKLTQEESNTLINLYHSILMKKSESSKGLVQKIKQSYRYKKLRIWMIELSK